MLKLVPVTEVKRRATDVIAAMRKSGKAVMVTEHGREAAVMVDLGVTYGQGWLFGRPGNLPGLR